MSIRNVFENFLFWVILLLCVAVMIFLLSYAQREHIKMSRREGLYPQSGHIMISVPPHWLMRTVAFRMRDGKILLCTYDKSGKTDHATYNRGLDGARIADPLTEMYNFCNEMGPRVLAK